MSTFKKWVVRPAKKWIANPGEESIYIFRRQRWMLDYSRYFSDYADVEIDRPIFLLGTKAGGITFTSRILRRNPVVVSVSGNSEYWSGADEMHNVYEPILPQTLTGAKHRTPKAKGFPSPRGWVYASDPLLPLYRNTAADVNPKATERFRRIIRWTIERNANGVTQPRFIDKSQLFTVKLSYLNAMIKDTRPKFILITRNPYATCFRQVKKGSIVAPDYDFNGKLALAAQHWTNSTKCAIEDSSEVESFMTVRFEDILTDPLTHMQSICEFAELEFDEEMLPQPHHELPSGSHYQNWWYPIRSEVNQKHLDQLTPEQADIIEQHCGGWAEKYGYYNPTRTKSPNGTPQPKTMASLALAESAAS